MSAYLDHAATTPVRPAAAAAFSDAVGTVGNPASVHTHGRRARLLVEQSREGLADGLGVSAHEIVFTSGGTESDNLAVKGLFLRAIDAEPAARNVLVPATEHPAVLESVNWLARRFNATVETVPVDDAGVVDVAWLEDRLQHPRSVALVAIMWANNETGVIQPIVEIAHLCSRAGVPLHCDAVAALPWFGPVGDWLCGPTTVAISGHKIGAPPGVGALIMHDVTPISTSQGGGQELRIRSGTVPVAMAYAFAAAMTASQQDRPLEVTRVQEIRDGLELGVQQIDPAVAINAGTALRLPSVSSVRIPGIDAQALLMALDAAGVSASSGSACAAGTARPSHVIEAMLGPGAAAETIRFSLGWTSSVEDVDALLDALPVALQRARAVAQIASPVGGIS